MASNELVDIYAKVLVSTRHEICKFGYGSGLDG